MREWRSPHTGAGVAPLLPFLFLRVYLSVLADDVSDLMKGGYGFDLALCCRTDDVQSVRTLFTCRLNLWLFVLTLQWRQEAEVSLI